MKENEQMELGRPRIRILSGIVSNLCKGSMIAGCNTTYWPGTTFSKYITGFLRKGWRGEWKNKRYVRTRSLTTGALGYMSYAPNQDPSANHFFVIARPDLALKAQYSPRRKEQGAKSKAQEGTKHKAMRICRSGTPLVPKSINFNPTKRSAHLSSPDITHLT